MVGTERQRWYSVPDQSRRGVLGGEGLSFPPPELRAEDDDLCGTLGAGARHDGPRGALDFTESTGRAGAQVHAFSLIVVARVGIRV
jgi:hypothetical protein